MNTPANQQTHLASAVRKINRHILPLFVVMFIVNYIDRVNVGFVQTHLEHDIGIGPAAYGFGAGLFFIGYALLEVPSNIMMQRFGARLWLTRIMFTWGLVACASAFVRGEHSFYILRFLLGAAEAGFFPGAIFYFTCWLPASERGRAMAIFLSGSAAASIISGPLAGALLSLDGLGLVGWQWMFLIEGSFSLVLCAATWFWLDSHPEDATWLTEDERRAISDTLEREQAERETTQHHGHGTSTLVMLRDPQILLFCFLYFVISLTVYGVTFWLPIIIASMGGLSEIEIGMLNSIPWIIAVVAMYGFASLARRYPAQRKWTALTFFIAAVGLAFSGHGNALACFVAICFASIGFKAASSLFWPIPQAYLDKRIAAGVIALINSVGGLGGFVAPSVFGILQARTHSVQGGLIALAVLSGLAGVAVLFAHSPTKGLRAGRAKPRTSPEQASLPSSGSSFQRPDETVEFA
ncbi:MFS transporter [Novosphingobium sp. 1949]|uniref:MFS transporter n=1 Tax=Novosphingobium organovorum TaxID=2930092 RepID=A0ABT0BCD2_9SPHN|nr:MFS transporter [Novosphingobium organovorum]MCJ2182535.1 MFS transporter [Novosphingobium organovorum]